MTTIALAFALGASGCSVKQYAIDRAADALAEGGSAFASDDDPQLVREAVPFSLKTIESLIEASPRNEKLLLAACRGFTQYSYAFVQQDADRLEDKDVKASQAQALRARRLYARARAYGQRGLEVRHPEFRKDPAKALAGTTKSDVPLLYWTAAAWAAEIALSKENPDAVADAPQMLALADRAVTLDDAYGEGAIPALMITLEMVRQGGQGDPATRARARFDRAVTLSGKTQASPYVSYAESVAVPLQDKVQFEAMLATALAIDPDAVPRHRLANVVLQQRARWLLAHKDSLFAE
ncbi:MAG: TRAP transporter TatT component family protein [Burkholderiales bacterium]|nr:TRAP transporter TatT component family protein [Burkholderiales bacterium]